jgi:hypothetical protein
VRIALLALKAMVGGYVITHLHSCGNYPEVHALMFAGMCAEHEAPVRDRARLILDLLPAIKQPKVRNTFQLLLVCLGPEAVQVALDDFEALDGASTSGPSPLLDALCRSGTPFCEALTARLKRERGRSALLALSWAGRLGERMEAHFTRPGWDVCFEEWQRSFSVVRESQLDPAALQHLRDAVARHIADESDEVRGCALRSLGELLDTNRTEVIRPYLQYPSP